MGKVDALSIAYFILGLLIICLNTAEMYSIYRKGKRRTSFDILLSSLSTADLFVGINMTCIAAMSLFGKFAAASQWETSYIDEKDFHIESALPFLIGHFSLLTSMCHILIITTDRLLAVYTPFRHRVWMTKGKVKVLACLSWLMAFPLLFILLIPSLLSSKSINDKDFSRDMSRGMSGVILVCIFLFVSMYIIIVILATKRLKARRHLSNETSSGIRRETRSSRKDAARKEKSFEDTEEDFEMTSRRSEATTSIMLPEIHVVTEEDNRGGQDIDDKNTELIDCTAAIPSAEDANDISLLNSEHISKDCLDSISETSQIHDFTSPRSSGKRLHSEFHREHKTVYSCILVIITFVLCTLPFAISSMQEISNNQLSGLLIISNSFFNPIVYYFKGILESKLMKLPFC